MSAVEENELRQVLIRLEADFMHGEGVRDDPDDIWDVVASEIGPRLREELEAEAFGAAPGVVAVQVNFSSGSLVVWVLVTVATGVVEGVGWLLASRLYGVFERWVRRFFGGHRELHITAMPYVPVRPERVGPTGSRPRLPDTSGSAWVDRVGPWIIALVSLLTLVFVAVWLVVTE